jgi:hypothetical protein
MNSRAARSTVTHCPRAAPAPTAAAAFTTCTAPSSPRGATTTCPPRSRVHRSTLNIRARLPARAARRGLGPTANHRPAADTTPYLLPRILGKQDLAREPGGAGKYHCSGSNAAQAGLWVAGEDFGGILTGHATDPNSGLLLVLLAAVFWPWR